MTIQFPVHPDDIKQLMRIRRYLIGYRHTNGWTQTQLSTMFKGSEGAGWVYGLENDGGWQWRLSRLQSWPEPFGLRLDARLELPARLSQKVHGDPEVAPLFLLSRQGEGDWKMWQRAYLTAALRTTRRAKRIRAVEMGHALACTPSAINSWERDSDEVMLPKVLHYARALGGWIRLGLEGDDQ